MVKKTLVSLAVLASLVGCGAPENTFHVRPYCTFDKPDPKKPTQQLAWTAFMDADDASLIVGCSYIVGTSEFVGVSAGNVCKVVLSGVAGTGTMVFTRTADGHGMDWKTSTTSLGTIPCYNGHGEHL